MPKLKSPGFYAEEVPTLPPGVAEVSSAIPAFIGYTHTTIFNENKLKLKPVKIQSMLEFVRFFGGLSPFEIQNVNIDLDLTAQYAVLNNQFYLYDSLQLYFLNGGGPCYIVSIGEYGEASDSAMPFIQGLDALDLFDEPTIYLFPDGVILEETELANVQKYALRKCGELMDRFTILDVKKNKSYSNNLDAVESFRNNIGMSNLNFGAAYTPWLTTMLSKTINASSITGIFTILNALPISLLNTEVKGIRIGDNIVNYQVLLGDLADIAANTNFKDIVSDFVNCLNDYVDGTNAQNPFVSGQVFDAVLTYNPDSTEVKDFWNANVRAIIASWAAEYTTATSVGADEYREIARNNILVGILNSVNFDRFNDLRKFTIEGLEEITNTFEYFLKDNIPYYFSLLKVLNNKLTEVPPSGAMAGLYYKIDSERGVWKAPASIPVKGVNGVSQLYTNTALADLNVDRIAGKSINAIRPIVGYGIMVMGARTLAGNHSEWRYIPVRRLFIFIEENLKKATSWVIYESNNKILWLKVRGQVENYLNDLWRKGALVGSKPADAYSVICGLNSMMTAQNVLDGKLIIEIRLAPIRPAEFIMLRISHQLQVSS